MRRRLQVLGWVLLGVGVVLVAAVIVMQTLESHSSDDFERRVGWANVWGFVVSAVGVAVVAGDKVVGGSARLELGVAEAEEELAAEVLKQEAEARSRLLGADDVGDQAANVRFVRGGGRFREVGGAGEGDLASVFAYYRSLSPGRLVVLGEAGAGKTVLALELAVRLLEQRERDAGGPVPVVISAAAWETSRGFEEWLAGHLAGRFGVSAKVAARLVRDRRVIPIVDGLDEMDAAERSPERAQVAVRALNSYMAGPERAAVVVTCRRAEYAGLGVELDRATHVEMVPLDGGEAAGYLLDQLRDEQELTRWEPVLAELERDPGGPVAAQLATPWRLVLALTVFRDGGDPAELLPDPARDEGDSAGAAAEGYLRRVERLLLSRYVPAAVRLHDPEGRYPVEMVQHWLTGLAAGLDWQARHGRSATDIELAHWWRPVGEYTTRLLAVTATPYTAIAIIISALTRNYYMLAPFVVLEVVVMGLTWSPTPRRIDVRRLFTRHSLRRFLGGYVVGLVGGIVGGIVFGLMGWSVNWIVDWTSVLIVVGLMIVLVGGLVGGLVVGLVVRFVGGFAVGIVGFVFGFTGSGPFFDFGEGFVFGIVSGLVFGIVGGLVDGIVGGIVGGLDDPSFEAVRPRDVIRADGRFGLVVGLVVGLVFGIVFGFINGSVVGIEVGFVGSFAAAFMVAFVGGFVIGAAVWARYHVCVVVAASRGLAPLRFGAFLEWAYHAGLLRLSGVAYQFRHRQLQDWLSSRQ